MAAKKAKKTKTKSVAKIKAKKSAPSKKTAKKLSLKGKKKPIAKVKPAAPIKNAPKASPKWEQFLTPLDDRLLVEIEKGEKRTAGGLYIPDTAVVSGNLQGKVVAAGPGHKNKKGKIRPMDVKTGDTVVFSEFVGTKLNLMGFDVQLLRESEILGIVEV